MNFNFKIPKVPEKVKPVRKTRVSLEGVTNSRVSRSNYSGNGHWTFDKQMGLDGHHGFIYLIINNESGRKYLGKKQYKGTGKINKGEVSNWPWYISSSTELSADIKKYGKSSFDFICLEEYKTKGGLAWAETWSLCHVEVSTNQDLWYNRDIGAVRWISKESVTDKHKIILRELAGIYEKI